MKRWCGFTWADGDDIHDCGQRGPHDRHVCANDGCEVSTPVTAGGGRKRGGRPPRERP